MAYPMFGVENYRKEHPAIKEGYVSSRNKDGTKPSAVGFEPVDGQRLYKGVGGNNSMGPKRRARGGTTGTTTVSPGGFAVRKRTKKHY